MAPHFLLICPQSGRTRTEYGQNSCDYTSKVVLSAYKRGLQTSLQRQGTCLYYRKGRSSRSNILLCLANNESNRQCALASKAILRLAITKDDSLSMRKRASRSL